MQGVQRYAFLEETGLCGIKNPDYLRKMVGTIVYVAMNLFGDLTFDGKDGDERFAFSLLLELDNAIT